MKCGHCKQDHGTLQEVRDCAALGTAPSQAEFDAVVKANTPAVELITERQLPFLMSLVQERPTWAQENDLLISNLDLLPKGRATKLITEALKLPKEVTLYNKQADDPIPGPDLLPDGYYALPSATGNNDLDFFRVKRKGNRTFVDRVIGGHPDYGLRRKDGIAAADRIILFGWQASGELYAKEIGNCYVCNRHLTDELSRRLGIGPVCRAG
jgi:hypothetical protein